MPSPGLLRRAAAVLSAVTAAGALIAGQAGGGPSPPQGGQTPVFRSGVNFVSVDVYPRRDGRIVEGLTASDFQVFEDGKPQAVETFEFITTELNPIDADRRDPSSLAEGDRIARDPHNRVFVVYLDLAHTSRVGSLYARQPVIDFLTRTIGRTDVFGFMTPELPAGQLAFGRRTEAIESQLRTFQGWGQAGEKIWPHNAVEERLMSCAFESEALIFAYREDLLQTSLENLMTRLGDLRDERKNVLFISEGWTPRRPMTQLAALRPGGGGQVPGIGVGRGGRIGIDNGVDAAGRPDPAQWCNQIISRLASQDFEQRFRDLLNRARAANVTFYPVDPGGLKVQPGGGSVNTLRTLAENTDGFAVVNTNDIEGAVRRISTDLSSFYLLGYYSTNTAANSRFREIDVRVKPAGIKVSARRGYVAVTPDVVARGRPSAPAVPAAVEEALGRLSRTRPDADVFVYAVQRSAGVEVVTELAPRLLRPGAGETVLRLTASGAQAERRETAVSLPSGVASVRAVITDALPGMGPWRVSARIDAPDGPVEGRADAEIGVATLIGHPMAMRGPASVRLPLTPAADLRLRRTERLRIEWPVLNPAVELRTELLGRDGQPLRVTLPDTRRSDDGRMAFLDLPMSALAEGEFLVGATASLDAVVERRLLAFRVVR